MQQQETTVLYTSFSNSLENLVKTKASSRNNAKKNKQKFNRVIE